MITFCPTVVDETEHTEQLSLKPSLVTPEGQNVIIIIAPSPSSPASSITATTCDSDPEWTPSPGPVSPAQVSAALTSLRGSLPGGQEGEEEGPEQDGRLRYR